MARSILDMNGSYCCRCNKSLSKTEVLQCDGCGCMPYCSRACQKKDWLNGHSVTCNKPPTNEELGFFQGTWLERSIPTCPRIVAKLKELETNLTMIQLKLFLANSETIINQASSLNLPLCDCVVVFDLRLCPHTITIKKYTEYRPDFECSRSRENITCVYYSCLYNGDLGEEKDRVNLATQRLFPHAWLLQSKWITSLSLNNQLASPALVGVKGCKISEYKRLRNVRRNKERLAQLGLLVPLEQARMGQG